MTRLNQELARLRADNDEMMTQLEADKKTKYINGMTGGRRTQKNHMVVTSI